MKIVLMGYMASGKSTIGKKLAKKHKIPFIDLDDYISERENLAIPDIFKLKGEIYFRKKETAYLNELLQQEGDMILAVGGGTPCYGINMELINKEAFSFYLKSSIQDVYMKLSKPKRKKKRPLVAAIANKDLKEFIAKHLFERAPYYERADMSIDILNKSKKEIVTEISLNMP